MANITSIKVRKTDTVYGIQDAAASLAIEQMKNGQDIDSFGDVETALADKADASDVETALAGKMPNYNLDKNIGIYYDAETGTASLVTNTTSNITQGSEDIPTSGAVYTALQNKVSWDANTKTGVHQWFYEVKEGYTITGDEQTGYNINAAANAITYIGKVANNTNYTIKKANAGNRFRVVLYPDIPSGTKQIDAVQIVLDNTLTEYTFNSGTFNYVAFTANATDAIDVNTIKGLCKLAEDISDADTPYAMTNRELTEKVQGIINAATNAADFAAFKTAIGNL